MDCLICYQKYERELEWREHIGKILKDQTVYRSRHDQSIIIKTTRNLGHEEFLYKKLSNGKWEKPLYGRLRHFDWEEIKWEPSEEQR